MHGGCINIANRAEGGAIVTIVLKARAKDEKR
jgi:nitrogen fixation/metabolism regulation signal transduction histidine kinase